MAGNIAFPFSFDSTGRTAAAGDDAHLRDMIELVLMTAAGERVNNPNFGCGAPQMVFGPASETVAATAQFLIQSALQQVLAPNILVNSLTVTPTEGGLAIDISYFNRLTQEQRTARFEPPASPP